MTRKSPYKHPVKSHVRSGMKVKKYERGQGNRPNNSTSREVGRGGVNYGVQVFYPGGSESYSVEGATYVGALKSGLVRMKAEAAPYRVHLKRGG